VDNAAGQRPDSFHLLSFQELSFNVVALSDVKDDTLIVGNFTFFVSEYVGPVVKPSYFAVFGNNSVGIMREFLPASFFAVTGNLLCYPIQIIGVHSRGVSNLAGNKLLGRVTKYLLF
jgi:hypothetical protein